MAGDKLRHRCQNLLRQGETILLEAEADCKLGRLSLFGKGRAYLTDSRLIWIRRSTPIIRPLLFWIPNEVVIERTSVERLQMERYAARAWLTIHVDDKMCAFRLGQGPHPFLRDNPKTTEEWLHHLQRDEPQPR